MQTSRSRRRFVRWLGLLLLLFSVVCAATAADMSGFVGQPVRITTRGHETYQGRLYAVLDDRVELVLADGQIIQILSEEIEEIRPIDASAGCRESGTHLDRWDRPRCDHPAAAHFTDLPYRLKEDLKESYS